MKGKQLSKITVTRQLVYSTRESLKSGHDRVTFQILCLTNHSKKSIKS